MQNKSHNFKEKEVVFYNYDTEGETTAQFGAVSFKTDVDLENVKVILINDYQTGVVRFDEVSLFSTDKGYVYAEEEDDINLDSTDELPTRITVDGTVYKTEPCNCSCAQCSKTYHVQYDGSAIDVYYNCSCDEEGTTCNCLGCRQERGTAETKDSHGNILTNTISNGTKSMINQNIYTSDGNYLAQSIDTNNQIVYYNYNTDNGLLTSYSEGSQNNAVAYTYNAVGALERVSQAVSGLSSGTTMSANYTYEDDRISSISHNGTTYNYEYDAFGNQTAVKVGSQNLVSYGYTNDKSTINSITYGNGMVISYTLDSDDNISLIKYNGNTLYSYEYTDGELSATYDFMSNIKSVYTDDFVTVYPFTGSGENITLGDAIYSISENDDGNTVETVFGTAYTFDDSEDEYNSTDDTVGSTKYAFYGSSTLGSTQKTDFFGRLVNDSTALMQNTELCSVVSTNYLYSDTGSSASGIVSGIESYLSGNQILDYSYSYDNKGNITEIRSVGQLVYKYVYDEANQLKTEYNFADNTAKTYVYDGNGNIVSKTPYTNVTGIDLTTATAGTSIAYEYNDSNWSDKLTSYNGQSITYDNIGNPTSYRGATLTWSGRLLTSYEVGTTRYEYAYNADGLRTQKKTYENNTLTNTVTYVWDNDRLLGSRSIAPNASDNGVILRYLYNSNDEIIGFVYNALTLLFVKNLQGDVVKVVGANGCNLALTLSYDAWGNVTYSNEDSSFAGIIRAVVTTLLNNITYRGYFYDSETNLYYLQSRYYDPEIGRFINSDDTDYIAYDGTPVSVNIFAYCGNNAVNHIDRCGNKAQKINPAVLIITILSLAKIFEKIIDENVKINIYKEYKNKGEIAIDFTSKKFYSAILAGYKILGDDIFTVLSNYTCSLFEDDDRFKRPFLLSNECVANEIKEHFLAYAKYCKNDKVSAPLILGVYYNSKLTIAHLSNNILAPIRFKNEFYDSVKEANIYESDVFNNFKESLGFDYFEGIRNCYKCKSCDPFYNSVKKKRTRIWSKEDRIKWIKEVEIKL